MTIPIIITHKNLGFVGHIFSPAPRTVNSKSETKTQAMITAHIGTIALKSIAVTISP